MSPWLISSKAKGRLVALITSRKTNVTRKVPNAFTSRRGGVHERLRSGNSKEEKRQGACLRKEAH